MIEPAEPPREISVVLFEGFELLDVFGPLEMFGGLPELFRIRLVGPSAGPVPSAQGPEVMAQTAYREASPADIVMVPGGVGTRPLVHDQGFLSWLASWARGAELVTSVCTGSGLLAAAGLLEGYRATSNKRSFTWAQRQGADVRWVPEARWVEDGSRWTSSGVAAGMDMALAIIARLHGHQMATELADRVEYHWHQEAALDPFAAKAGLVTE